MPLNAMTTHKKMSSRRLTCSGVKSSVCLGLDKITRNSMTSSTLSSQSSFLSANLNNFSGIFLLVMILRNSSCYNNRSQYIKL